MFKMSRGRTKSQSIQYWFSGLSLRIETLHSAFSHSLHFLCLSSLSMSFCLPVSLSLSIHIQCVFFIELKVFVNLTYLYLSEIKKQGLIFSVGIGHLIICRKKLDLDRGFLSKPVFLLDACRASVEL